MALINLRNALMTGKRLPYDAEVEYLESTGTQWIDTGVSISDASLADVTWNVEAVSYNDGCMGAYGGSSYASMYFNLYLNKFYMRNMRTSGGSFSGVSGFNTVRFSGGNSYLNGTAVETEIPLNTKPVPTMYLFAYNKKGTTSGFCKARVSSFIVKENGVLVRDFIPVRKGTVGYLYDRVSGKLFGNAGTGDFVLGPDVVPVEYIESHGTEYIDTGVIPVHHEAKIKFSTPTIPLSGYMCGSFTADNRYYPVAFLNRNITIFNAVNTIVAKYGNDGNPHTIVYNSNGGSCYFDDVAAGVLAQTSLTTNNPIYLFGTSTSTGPSGRVAGRLYETELKDNSIDSLVRKFRPIRVGTEGAMMDVLTRRIYRNAGTGAFGYGNDLKYPIPAA